MGKFFIRELSRLDIASINSWRNDRDVIGNLGSPFRYISEEVDNDWIEAYFKNRSKCVRLAICENELYKIIGAVYLLNIDWVSRSCEFAIWIGEKKFQGCGAGTFATQNALKHAFLDLNLNRVYLTVLESNKRAIALYRKLGFSVEGMHRQSVYKDGRYQDMVSMSLLASEFVHT